MNLATWTKLRIRIEIALTLREGGSPQLAIDRTYARMVESSLEQVDRKQVEDAYAEMSKDGPVDPKDYLLAYRVSGSGECMHVSVITRTTSYGYFVGSSFVNHRWHSSWDISRKAALDKFIDAKRKAVAHLGGMYRAECAALEAARKLVEVE